MIRTIRALFLRCMLREKLLLLAFILIGVLLWLSGFSSRTGRFWCEQRSTTQMLKSQADVLAQGPAIEASAQKAASQLDAAKTLNENRLVTTIQHLAAEAGLRNFQSSSSPTTRSSDKVATHTFNFTINRINGNADWPALIKFYQALQAHSPYIGIDKFTLNASGTQHTVAMTVSSIEVIQ